MLDATNDQLDFPILYAVARDGIAKIDLEHEGLNLSPLLDTIVEHVPEPQRPNEANFKMR